MSRIDVGGSNLELPVTVEVPQQADEPLDHEGV
jgi:hypothetical protein